MSAHPVDAAARTFGERAADSVAGAFGSWRYLIIQTAAVVAWIVYNVSVAAGALRFDPYPFILLNLAFSTQASYAAPIILLAGNRQAAIDRARAEHDYQVNQRALAGIRAICEHLDLELDELLDAS